MNDDLLATGIVGFDEVLQGGFVSNRVHLLLGGPGAGKTTLAMQFLMEGERIGERSLYVTLSESREELQIIALSHGFDISKVNILEFLAFQDKFSPDAQYTVFHPADVELTQTISAFMAEVARIEPVRVVIDSLSEMRLLAQDPLRFRRHILALKQFFAGRGCTVLLLDDNSSERRDLQLESIAHGVVSLEQLAPEYGAERRRLRVMKMRGRAYRGGYHDFRIQRGGLAVFPRVTSVGQDQSGGFRVIKSGIKNLDDLLGGGVHAGTSTLLMGPAGTGKSSLATQYVAAAAGRGEHAAIFTFDEGRHTYMTRCESLGFGISEFIECGNVRIFQIDPAELSPGEFAERVRQEVEAKAGIVVIDSLNGYLSAMPEERFLTIQLHEILTYLNARGVATFLIVAQHGLLGERIISPVDTSYLADTVILLRYFEAFGEVRKAVSVLKKRSGIHEKAIRELVIDDHGLRVGDQLKSFSGVLGGVPIYNSNLDGPTEGLIH